MTNEPSRSWLQRIGIFVLHSVAATAITVFSVLLLGTAVEKWISAEFADRLIGGPFFFPFLLVGLCLGFLINKALKSESARWVWILPLLLFCILLTDQIRYPGTEGSLHDIWLAYFGNNDTNCGGTECIYELFGTWPLVSSLAYAIGGTTTLKFGTPEQQRKP